MRPHGANSEENLDLKATEWDNSIEKPGFQQKPRGIFFTAEKPGCFRKECIDASDLDDGCAKTKEIN